MIGTIITYNETASLAVIVGSDGLKYVTELGHGAGLKLFAAVKFNATVVGGGRYALNVELI